MKLTKSTLKTIIKEEIENLKEVLTGDPIVDAMMMDAIKDFDEREAERRKAEDAIKAATGPEKAALQAELQKRLSNIPSLESMLIGDPETKKALELIGRAEREIDNINKQLAQNAKNYEEDDNEGQYRETIGDLYPRRKAQQAKLAKAQEFADRKADEFLKQREKMVADAKARLANMTRI